MKKIKMAIPCMFTLWNKNKKIKKKLLFARKIIFFCLDTECIAHIIIQNRK